MGQSVELFDDGQFDGRIALPLLDEFGQFVQNSALHLELTQGTSFPALQWTKTAQILKEVSRSTTLLTTCKLKSTISMNADPDFEVMDPRAVPKVALRNLTTES